MHSSVHNAVGNEREHCAMSDNVKMNGFVTSLPVSSSNGE